MVTRGDRVVFLTGGEPPRGLPRFEYVRGVVERTTPDAAIVATPYCEVVVPLWALDREVSR